jgi:hypothetical protein
LYVQFNIIFIAEPIAPDNIAKATSIGGEFSDYALTDVTTGTILGTGTNDNGYMVIAYRDGSTGGVIVEPEI